MGGTDAVVLDVPVGEQEAAVALVLRGEECTWRAGGVTRPGRDAAGRHLVSPVELALGAADLPPDGAVVRVLRVRHATGGSGAGAPPAAAPTRLVLVPSADPLSWRDVVPPDLGAARDGRLLVVVPDLCATTRGGLATLAATADGRAWLADAVATYDVVLGVDQATVVDGTRRSAADLVALLGRLGPAAVDLVGHGRGAVVCLDVLDTWRGGAADRPPLRRVALVGAPDLGGSASEVGSLLDELTGRAAAVVAELLGTRGADAVVGVVARGLAGPLVPLVGALGGPASTGMPGAVGAGAGDASAALPVVDGVEVVDLRSPAVRPSGLPSDAELLASLRSGLGLTARDARPTGPVALGKTQGAGGDGAGTARETHELGARVEQEIVLDEVTTLEVQLAAGRVDVEGPGYVSGTARLTLDPDLPVVVDVLPRRNVVVEGVSRLELAPPQEGDAPARRYVDLRGVAVGPAAVDVLARQGNAPLATVTLEPEVVAAATGRPPTLEATVVAHPSAPLSSSIHQLTVWREDAVEGTRFNAVLVSPLVDRTRRFVGPVIAADLEAHLAGVRTRIEEAAGWGEDGDELVDEIRALGIELFTALLHEDLRQLLWEHRERLRGLQVMTNEPHVPWELVHLCPPDGSWPDGSWFLADLGLVRWLEHLGGPFPPPRFSLDEAVAVAPHYPPGSGWELPGVDEEVAHLRDLFTVREVPATRRDVRRALAEPFDLFHYAGHGTAAPGAGLDAELLLGVDVGPDLATTKETLPSLLVRHERITAGGRRPMVVLNACQVGSGQQRLAGLGGFAEAFLVAGAGIVVAPLWSVGDEPAVAFVHRLYDRLRAGDDVSTASLAARQHAREHGELSWLAYTVHANPEARLEGAGGAGATP